MMESVLGFIILKFVMWIFHSRKIEDVSYIIIGGIDFDSKSDLVSY